MGDRTIALEGWLQGKGISPVQLAPLEIPTFAEPQFAQSAQLIAAPSQFVDAGERVFYEVRLRNDGDGPSNRLLIRVVPTNLAVYVPSSTTLNGLAVADDGGVSQLWSQRGLALADVNPGVELRIRFEMSVIAPLAAGTTLETRAVLEWGTGQTIAIAAPALKVQAQPTLGESTIGTPFSIAQFFPAQPPAYDVLPLPEPDRAFRPAEPIAAAPPPDLLDVRVPQEHVPQEHVPEEHVEEVAVDMTPIGPPVDVVTEPIPQAIVDVIAANADTLVQESEPREPEPEPEAAPEPEPVRSRSAALLGSLGGAPRYDAADARPGRCGRTGATFVCDAPALAGSSVGRFACACRRHSRQPIVRCARRWIAFSCACGCRVWPLPPRISKIATAGLRCARSSTNSSLRPYKRPPELRAGVVRLRGTVDVDLLHSLSGELETAPLGAVTPWVINAHLLGRTIANDGTENDSPWPLPGGAAQSAHGSFGVADRRISSRVDDERESLARRIAGQRPRSVARGRALACQVIDSPFILAGIIVVIVAIVLGIAANIIRTRSEHSYSIPKPARAYEPDDAVGEPADLSKLDALMSTPIAEEPEPVADLEPRTARPRATRSSSTYRNAWKTIRCRIFGRVWSRRKTAS